MEEQTSRFSRQEGLVPSQELSNKFISIVGAGGIGSWTTLALAKMGAQHITVYDPDTVEEANTAAQLYTIGDIGRSKVEALAEYVDLFTQQEIEAVNLGINEESFHILHVSQILIAAVDSMQSRKDIFSLLNRDSEEPRILIDGRMAANEINVYCIPLDDAEAVAFYETTLFADNEARVIPCSERAVVYNTQIIAGLITDHVAHIVRGETPPREIIMDLFNYTLMT